MNMILKPVCHLPSKPSSKDGASTHLDTIAVLCEELEADSRAEAYKDGHEDKVEGQLPCVVHQVQRPAAPSKPEWRPFSVRSSCPCGNQQEIWIGSLTKLIYQRPLHRHRDAQPASLYLMSCAPTSTVSIRTTQGATRTPGDLAWCAASTRRGERRA